MPWLGGGANSPHGHADHVLASPWWINRVEGDPRLRGLEPDDRGRSRREFAAIAAQLGLAAWLIGAMVASAMPPPRPSAPVLRVATGLGEGDRAEAERRPLRRPFAAEPREG